MISPAEGIAVAGDVNYNGRRNEETQKLNKDKHGGIRVKKERKEGFLNIHADALSVMHTGTEVSIKCFNGTGTIFVKTEKSEIAAGDDCAVKEFEVSKDEQLFTTRPWIEWC